MDNIEKTLRAVELSGYKVEQWSDTQFEICGEAFSAFLQISESEAALEFHNVFPISYGSLPEGKKQLVQDGLSILNRLMKGRWCLEELEDGTEEEDLQFLVYQATWPVTAWDQELLATLEMLSEVRGFARQLMLIAENKEV